MGIPNLHISQLLCFRPLSNDLTFYLNNFLDEIDTVLVGTLTHLKWDSAVIFFDKKHGEDKKAVGFFCCSLGL